jgi:epidermal growth factor receptor substrate 15
MSSAHASFAPTPSELALTNEIFKTADPQNLGIVTGTAAIGVFGGSKLSPATLGQIWGISDIDNNGFLTKKGVAIAVRLMGWAQKGEVVSETLLTKGQISASATLFVSALTSHS